MKGRGKKKGQMTNRLTKLAKTLRKNSTHVEALLWQRLKARQLERIKFRRQQPLEDFIFDFNKGMIMLIFADIFYSKKI